jgi:hypothetical protein
MRSFGQGGRGELTSRTAGMKQLHTRFQTTIVILKGVGDAYDGSSIWGVKKVKGESQYTTSRVGGATKVVR